MSGRYGRTLFGLGRRRRPQPAGAAAPAAQDERQAARLAAVAAGLGRVSHDLRGILAPALLGAERMQQHPDAAVRRHAEVMLRAIERALGVLADQLGPLRAELPVVQQIPVKLQPAIDGAVPRGLRVRHAVPEALAVLAHAGSLQRGLKGLFAELHRRGAATAALEVEIVQRHIVLTCTHDGRPEPEQEPDPSAPTDGGAADWSAARDFLRACGAELHTPPGTRLSLSLQRA